MLRIRSNLGVEPITVTAGATLTAGVGFLLGQLLLYPTKDATSGQTVACHAMFVGEVGKTSALAITAGDALYWDDSGKVVNKTSSGQKECGWALADAANPSSYVLALILPQPRTSVAA